FSTIALRSASSAFCGCATVVGGRYEDVSFLSNPPDANVEIISLGKKHDRYHTKTPGTLTLRRKNSYEVRYTKDGYKPVSSILSNKMGKATAGSALGNAVVGGIVGYGVDSYTGAAYNLLPNPMLINLEPVSDNKTDVDVSTGSSSDEPKKGSNPETKE
ncbi:MAG: hypothetical protein AAB288_01950, partial [Acidobacteriota bacterium]